MDAFVVEFRKETVPHAAASILHVLLKLCLSCRQLLNYSTLFSKLSMIRGKNILQISFLVTLLSASGSALGMLLDIMADNTNFVCR